MCGVWCGLLGGIGKEMGQGSAPGELYKSGLPKRYFMHFQTFKTNSSLHNPHICAIYAGTL